MSWKSRPHVDSYLFHLAGEAASVAKHRQTMEAMDPVPGDLMGDDVAGPVFDAPLSDKARAEFARQSFAGSEDAGEVDLPSYEDGVPVLLQVRRLDWTGDGLEGFTLGTRVGDIATGSASLEGIEALSEDPDVLRIDVSRDAGREELNVSAPAVGTTRVHGTLNEKGRHALVGVIDGGIDVLHEAFLGADGRSRVLAIWDQVDPTGPGPQDASGRQLGGTLHERSDIDRYISTGVLPNGLKRDPRGHGTHVASIAAGRAVRNCPGGIAPEAGLVVVIPKISTPAGDPNSIGYSRAHVDALAFLDKIASDEGRPMVVNVSLGMNAGAHDGSSTLEAAFDNFTSRGRMPGRVIVKSAGNVGDKKLHARFQIGDGQQIELLWDSWSTPRRADVVELWFNSADDLSFTLSAPSGQGTSNMLSRLTPKIAGVMANGNAFSMTLDRFNRDNGDTRVAITVSRGTAQGIATGRWILTARSGRVASTGHVHAWIERPDAGTTIEFATEIAEGGSLSIPGTAGSVIAVAAVDRAMNGQVTSFSSRGGTRDGRAKPDIGAPGFQIRAASSGTKAGVVAKDGTSMAAPHVSGAIALLMSQQIETGQPQLNANQIRAALTQSARGFNGHWNASRGWGMLDIPSLLALFRPPGTS